MMGMFKICPIKDEYRPKNSKNNTFGFF